MEHSESHAGYDWAEDSGALLAHGSWVRSLASAILRDEGLAEDVAQDAWVALLRHSDERGGPIGDLRAWMASVVRNLSKRKMRSESLRRGEELSEEAERTAPTTPEVLEREALRRRVVDAVLELKEPFRSVVLMRFFEELEPVRIAQILRVPRSTVRTQLQRGLAQVRERLQSEHGGDTSWLLALVPLAHPGSSVTATALKHTPLLPALLMTTQAKVAVAVLVAATLSIVTITMVEPTEQNGVTQSFPKTEELEISKSEELANDPATLSNRTSVQSDSVKTVSEVDDSEPATVADSTPLVRAKGRVLNADARAEVGVSLRVRGETTELAVSGASGEFEVEGVEQSVWIEAADRAWVTLRFGRLAKQAERSHPLVVVAPRHELAGVVIDEQGQPIANVRVGLELPPIANRFQDDLEGSAKAAAVRSVSDELGRFALPDSAYVEGAELVALVDGFLPYRIPEPEFPSSSLELVLKRPTSGPGVLTGRVVNPFDEPVADARVSFGLASTRTDDQGWFHFDRSDQHSSNAMLGMVDVDRLIAFADGWIPARVWAENQAGQLVWPQPLVLRLDHAPLRIVGHVVDPDGEPVSGARVWITDPTVFAMREDTSFEMLETELGGYSPAGDWNWTETQSDGRFIIDGLEDRAYNLRVMQLESFVGARANQVLAGNETLTIVLDDVEPWELVAGRVLANDGQPLADINVEANAFLFVSDYNGNGSRTTEQVGATTTDAEGYFEFEQLTRETTMLRFNGEGVRYHDLYLNDWRGHTATTGNLDALEVVLSRRLYLQLDLDDANEADGFLVMDDAMQVQQVQVYEADENVRQTYNPSITSGRSSVVTVPEGVTTIVLTKNGTRLRTIEVNLVPGEVNRVR